MGQHWTCWKPRKKYKETVCTIGYYGEKLYVVKKKQLKLLENYHSLKKKIISVKFFFLKLIFSNLLRFLDISSAVFFCKKLIFFLYEKEIHSYSTPVLKK